MLMTTIVATAGLLGTASSVSWGQHGHGHEGGHQAAEACSAEFDKVAAEGRGFGLAPKSARLLEAEAKLREPRG